MSFALLPSVAMTNKRHLYFDQQKPFEEPADAEHANIPQGMFARRPPTQEDEYFFEEERSLDLPLETVNFSLSSEAESSWDRIFQRMVQRTNTEWRP